MATLRAKALRTKLVCSASSPDTTALSTLFGFIHLHAGRSSNPDALLTLLTVITLSGSERLLWRRVWLGPILAGVFLLNILFTRLSEAPGPGLQAPGQAP